MRQFSIDRYSDTRISREKQNSAYQRLHENLKSFENIRFDFFDDESTMFLKNQGVGVPFLFFGHNESSVSRMGGNTVLSMFAQSSDAQIQSDFFGSRNSVASGDRVVRFYGIAGVKFRVPLGMSSEEYDLLGGMPNEIKRGILISAFNVVNPQENLHPHLKYHNKAKVFDLISQDDDVLVFVPWEFVEIGGGNQNTYKDPDEDLYKDNMSKVRLEEIRRKAEEFFEKILDPPAFSNTAPSSTSGYVPSKRTSDAPPQRNRTTLPLRQINVRNAVISVGIGSATAVAYNAMAEEPTPLKCIGVGTVGTIVGYIGASYLLPESAPQTAEQKSLASGVAEVNRQLDAKTQTSMKQVSTLPNQVKAPNVPPVPQKP